ncbi:tRNA (adenosine(37)-N6)-threonylcarbamoyltransferase complex ATPase subunit type 1 TsaE [Marinomonas epiphytica]
MGFEKEVYGEEAMLEFGKLLSSALNSACTVYLQGDLGMGKTTLVRGFLHGLGYTGPVKSPTYTLVEPYEASNLELYHFDLYRVGDPEELEFMGIRDYFNEQSVCLVEWAEMGRGVLPTQDIEISLSLIRGGRKVVVEATTKHGEELLSVLSEAAVG